MNDGVIAVKLYSLEKQIEEKDKEIDRLNNKINKAIEDIQFCLKSICQEKGMSIDERTRNEMQSCIEVFKETLKVLQSGDKE